MSSKPLALRLALYLAISAVVLPYFHIIATLLTPGGIGHKTAMGEKMKGLYPYHFVPMVKLCQKLQVMYNEHPEDYFAKERLNILESLKTFELHPYFQLSNVPNLSDWQTMLHERVKLFRRRMDEEGRRDFEMEKDRCKMYSFYRKHGLPLVEQHGEWHELDALLASVRDGSAFANVSAWPVFWKACHLTQSSSAATRAIKAAPSAAEREDLAAWLESKWHFRANDFERVWAKDGNAITEGITPGFLLQAPMKTSAEFRVQGRISVGLAEVRVEVLWGRAYLALMDGVTVFTRDGNTQDFSGAETFMQRSPVYSDHWFFHEGHAQCVFDVAERAARIAGVDSIRIDIFMDRARPDGCVLNENSLSSGMVYWGHEPFLTQLWVEPHNKQLYTLRQTADSVLEQ